MGFLLFCHTHTRWKRVKIAHFVWVSLCLWPRKKPSCPPPPPSSVLVVVAKEKILLPRKELCFSMNFLCLTFCTDLALSYLLKLSSVCLQRKAIRNPFKREHKNRWQRHNYIMRLVNANGDMFVPLDWQSITNNSLFQLPPWRSAELDMVLINRICGANPAGKKNKFILV